MRLHVLSDLHIDHDPEWVLPRVEADVTIVAGDVHGGLRGMAAFAGRGRPVLYVPGNHEYYGENRRGLAAAMPLYARAAGITVLDQTQAVIGGVRFLGTTLWTDFELFGAHNLHLTLEAADRHMNDYLSIRDGDAWFTPHKARELHKEAVAWLARTLDEPFAGPTVVITHHAPHINSLPEEHRRKVLAAAFASDLTRLLGKARLWVHGHIHHSCDYELAGTRIVCNPKGYRDQNPDFRADLVVELKAQAA